MGLGNNKKKVFKYENEKKQAYLATMKKNTSETYGRILGYAESVEEELGKPISEFTFKNFFKLVEELHVNNSNTLASYLAVYSNYLDFLLEQGVLESNLLGDTLFKVFDTAIDKEEYITYHEIQRVTSNMANAQDSVLIWLIFEGVNGQAFSEISNLTINDVDFENGILHLKNEVKNGVFVERDLKVRYPETLEEIQSAFNQEIYFNAGTTRQSTTPLTRDSNGYVLRPVATANRNLQSSKLLKNALFRRLRIGQELFNVNQFKPKLIARSGMLDYAIELVGDNEYETSYNRAIATRFNYRNHDNLRGFITPESVDEYRKKSKL